MSLPKLSNARLPWRLSDGHVLVGTLYGIPCDVVSLHAWPGLTLWYTRFEMYWTRDQTVVTAPAAAARRGLPLPHSSPFVFELLRVRVLACGHAPRLATQLYRKHAQCTVAVSSVQCAKHTDKRPVHRPSCKADPRLETGFRRFALPASVAPSLSRSPHVLSCVSVSPVRG